MRRPQKWPDCDDDIKQFVHELIGLLRDEWSDKLTGVYLHGSLAMGSYYRPKSDMDLIVVVEEALESRCAERVGIMIAKKAAARPTVGNIELSAITAFTARNIPVPTPFELHYGTDWHERILGGQVDYHSPRTDPDLSSHLMYVVQRGICLFGKTIDEAFGPVRWQYFMDAVLDDLDWILEEEHILESPYYSVLNICRVLQLFHQNNQTVHSKDEGGEWGLKQLPELFHPLIQQALHIYRSSETVAEEQRKTGGKQWNEADLLAFRDYARLKAKHDFTI